MRSPSATELLPNNKLLWKLSNSDREALLPQLESVHLRLKQVTSERDKPISYIYFPGSCVLSVLSLMESGAAVEVGTIGNEGFAGVEVLIGAELASETTICQ